MGRLNNHNKFIELRAEYPTLVYEKYDIWEDNDNIKLGFIFKLSEEIVFNPTITINKKNFNFKLGANDKRLKGMVFNIGLIELLSYWKCACPPKIVLKAGALTEEQKKWWKKLYYNGLGEFFYINSIDTNIDDFVEIVNESSEFIQKERFETVEGNIIPVGGGKDSIVTLETLSEYKMQNTCLILNPRGASIESTITAGYSRDSIFELDRKLDTKLLELNKKGFLNGHTPFSALLAFITLFSAALLGKKYIVLSNESSANESNIEGSDVNHQYSKSIELEKDFTSYTKQYITEDINYFSLLRPLSEFQIAKVFSKHKKYHGIFKSCNAGSKDDIWCGKCSKCLFVYIMLAPFLDDTELIKIFGKNLFEDKELLQVFKKLVGSQKVKPFDCVGTKDEINTALTITIKKHKDKNYPYLQAYYKRNLSSLIKKGAIDYYNKYFNEDNLLPEKFEVLLRKNI